MNQILSRALSFSSQGNVPADNDQDSMYQAKYIAALEEKLKITMERDTMAKLLEEKTIQLQSLLKYSAELERKLGLSSDVVEGSCSSWLDVVRKYFNSFHDDPEKYDMSVESFLKGHNLPIVKVDSDSSPGKFYAIPLEVQVEFAAFFSDIWRKGLRCNLVNLNYSWKLNVTRELY